MKIEKIESDIYKYLYKISFDEGNVKYPDFKEVVIWYQDGPSVRSQIYYIDAANGVENNGTISIFYSLVQSKWLLLNSAYDTTGQLNNPVASFLLEANIHQKRLMTLIDRFDDISFLILDKINERI